MSSDQEWANQSLRRALQDIQDAATKPLHVEIERLRAERDEAVRLCEVHKEDAMREIAEANELAARADEAVALLREAPLGQHDRGWWNRIDAFLSKLQERQP